jgi:hypothetical protein
VCVDLALALVDGDLVFWRTGYLLLQLQVVENTLVQGPLELPALPKLLIVVVEALPVLAELYQAVLVHVIQSVSLVSERSSSCAISGSVSCQFGP